MKKQTKKIIAIAILAVVFVGIAYFFIQRSKLNSDKALAAAETETGSRKFLKYLENYLDRKEFQVFKHWTTTFITEDSDKVQRWIENSTAESIQLGLPEEVALWRSFLWQMVEAKDLSRGKWDRIAVDSLTMYGV